jgi:hypothetical protein
MNEVQTITGDPNAAAVSGIVPGTTVWVRVRTAALKGLMGGWRDPVKAESDDTPRCRCRGNHRGLTAGARHERSLVFTKPNERDRPVTASRLFVCHSELVEESLRDVKCAPMRVD